jgi:hypothetical protein
VLFLACIAVMEEMVASQIAHEKADDYIIFFG